MESQTKPASTSGKKNGPGVSLRQVKPKHNPAPRGGNNMNEDIRSRLEKRNQDRIDRLKLASRAGKVTVITCSDIFNSLPASSPPPSLPASNPAEESRRGTSKPTKIPMINQRNKPGSASRPSNNATTTRPISGTRGCGTGRRAKNRTAVARRDEASPVDMQESEARQLHMIESSEMPFDNLSCSQQATCDTTDLVDDVDDSFDVCDFESEEVRRRYYQEMLNLEEGALQARLQFEKELLDKAKKQKKEIEIQQAKQDLTNKKVLDETVLKLEATKKKRVLLEAINDSLKEEQLKQEERKKVQAFQIQEQQEKHQLMNKVRTNITEQLKKHEQSAMTTANTKKPYPKSSLRKPISNEIAPPALKHKSVTIREDLSIIQNVPDTLSQYSLMSSLPSGYYSDGYSTADVCLSCGYGECICEDDEGDSASDSEGLSRTDTFHNIFDEKKYNIGLSDFSSLHTTGSKSLPSVNPYTSAVGSTNSNTANARKIKEAKSDSLGTSAAGTGLRPIAEDFNLRESKERLSSSSSSSSSSNTKARPKSGRTNKPRIHDSPSARATSSADDEQDIRSTTGRLVSSVLTNASETVQRMGKKVPRDSLTIKNSCKRCTTKGK